MQILYMGSQWSLELVDIREDWISSLTFLVIGLSASSFFISPQLHLGKIAQIVSLSKYILSMSLSLSFIVLAYYGDFPPIIIFHLLENDTSHF